MTTRNNTGWMDRAACKGMDGEIFFPLTAGESLKPRRVCYGCSVRSECLNYAMDDPSISGVWGGLTENQRRRDRVLRRMGPLVLDYFPKILAKKLRLPSC